MAETRSPLDRTICQLWSHTLHQQQESLQVYFPLNRIVSYKPDKQPQRRSTETNEYTSWTCLLFGVREQVEQLVSLFLNFHENSQQSAVLADYGLVQLPVSKHSSISI